MDSEEEVRLVGGNMNSPRRIGDKVYRRANESTETIHRLLMHVRKKGVCFVPTPYGINESKEEILSFIDGEVPHSMPNWIWNDDVIKDIAKAQRLWHDATADFDFKNAIWQYKTPTMSEVVCHNDWAPYNVVFHNEKFIGVIDFDLCAPGSRLWDIAYTLYRFIPVMPQEEYEKGDETSPFDIAEIVRRIRLFLYAYSKGQNDFEFTNQEIFEMVSQRLVCISEWTYNYALQTNNDELVRNARMYKRHSLWVAEIKDNWANV